MKKKIICLAAAVLLAVSLILCACSSGTTSLTADFGNNAKAAEEMAQSSSALPGYGGDEGLYYSATNKAANGLSDALTTDTSLRKLVKTVRVTMETTEFEDTVAKLKSLAASAGGYVESASVTGQSYASASRRSAAFVFRIPVTVLDQVVGSLNGLGNITFQQEDVSDITLTYTDTASRVSALKAQRDSLLAMLEKADNLSDLLEIQDHLSDVEYQLDSYESRLRVYDNQVDYSTVTLTLNEVIIYSEEPQAEPQTFGEKLASRFQDSLKAIGRFFSDLALFVLGCAPILLLIAAVIIALILVIRRLSRKANSKAAAQEKSQEAPETKAE